MPVCIEDRSFVESSFGVCIDTRPGRDVSYRLARARLGKGEVSAWTMLIFGGFRQLIESLD